VLVANINLSPWLL